jgi:hypothetical protein
MSNAAKSSININGVVFHTDGSGAPATVECAGYVYACDWLNGYRATCIRPQAGSRRESEIAARRVQAAYAAYVANNAPDGWFTANAKMYADD